MAFPQTPLDTRVELQLGSSHVKCGAIGAGISVDTGGYIYTPDSTVLGITADIDIRVDLAAVDWTPQTELALCAKYSTTGENRSWYFRLQTDGTLELVTSPNGTFASIVNGVSTAAVGAANGTRKAVRVTLDVVSGGNRVYTFYTATSISGTWVQLGSTVTTAGTTSIFDGNADVSLGVGHGGASLVTGAGPFVGKIYGFELRSGIGGTRVAGVDFTVANPKRAWEGTQRVDGFEGETWHVSGSSVVVREWTDVTADVRERAKVEISRGQPDEHFVSDPGSCAYELDNRTGNYSPHNPNGQYYGLINQNTETRVSVPAQTTRLLLPRQVDDYAFCYDSAGLSVTGDIDVRIDLHLPSWRGLDTILMGKHVEGSASLSWLLLLNYQGYLYLVHSANGTAEITAQATAVIPHPLHGRKAVRATLDVNNGAAGHTVAFYTAADMDSSWTQLGSSVVTAGTTAVFDGTNEVRVGGYDTAYIGGGHAEVYEVEIRNGIGGSLVGNPDFKVGTAGASTLTDAQSNVWYFAGTAEIGDRDYRFHGEVSSWPPRWDVSGNDVYTPVQAAGVMRRLGQGVSPLKSTLYRGFTSLEDNISFSGTPIDERILCYWPCEDSEDAEFISSAFGGSPIFPLNGTPDYASFSDFKCSEALPTFNLTWWKAQIPSYSDTAEEFQVWFLLAVPAGGVTSDCAVFRIFENGGTDTAIWQVDITTAGSMRLRAFDLALSTIVDSGVTAFAMNGGLRRVSVEMAQNGTGIDWALRVRDAETGVATSASGTLASATLGVMAHFDFNHELLLDDVACGHITLHNLVLSSSDFVQELQAWKGEAAGERIRRLCAEEGIGYITTGDKIDTALMGPQLPKEFLDLVSEAATVDMGMLYEPRSWLGLAYRTRVSMYSQDPTLTLDYASEHLSPPLEPVDDDQRIVNDVTVRRVGGGRERKVHYDGSALCVCNIGRYDMEITVNVLADQDLPDQAQWRLHVGLIDEYRYPSVSVELARAPFVASAALSASARALDAGDRLIIENPPAWLPPEDISQLAAGFNETLHNFSHFFEWNCVPGSPWDVGAYSEARYSGDGSHLGAAVTSGATSLTVEIPSGPLWDDADQPFDIVVSGEVMTVTAVSGGSSPQTFTVVRSVNGVVKSHLEGEFVELSDLGYYAL